MKTAVSPRMYTPGLSVPSFVSMCWTHGSNEPPSGSLIAGANSATAASRSAGEKIRTFGSEIWIPQLEPRLAIPSATG